MCTLNGQGVANGQFEIMVSESTIDIIIRSSSLTLSQISACCSSCETGSRVSCQDDNGKSYSGSCNSLCTRTCGSVVTLTGCCGV